MVFYISGDKEAEKEEMSEGNREEAELTTTPNTNPASTLFPQLDPNS